MFATIFRSRVKPGQEQAMRDLNDRWATERLPTVEGFVAEYVIESVNQPGEYLGIAIFDSPENFRKNASDPEQDRWYRQLREFLVSDPEWNDGPVVFALDNSKKEASV